MDRISSYKVVEKFILGTDRIVDKQAVPFYGDLEAVAGIASLFVGPEEVADQMQLIAIPKCDGAIKVRGDSMTPLVMPGDIVCYKVVPNRRGGLFFGKMYLVAYDLDGDEHISVKYVYQSELEGHYRLESENPRHAPRDIPVSSVRLMGIVKATVRFSTME